ncbi:MAG: phosphate acetyltransferase, partial [Deltaproteobacteria bacterium]|nr:phosphate acetyltransferase [Deltaproteobacteria bacterium]
TSFLPFKDRLKNECRLVPGRLGLTDSADPRALSVALQLLSEGTVASVSLYTAKSDTLELARDHGIDLERVSTGLVWAAPTGTQLGSAARQQLAATHLVSGQLDAVLGGNQATTAEVIRAGIKTVGLATGIKTVSGSFIMHRPAGALGALSSEATYLFADCGVVISPTTEQLIDIAAASVQTWQELQPDVPARVAFLSFSTKGSAHHAAQATVAAAAQGFRAAYPSIISDGELQFDAAFDVAIAARKAPGSPVAGQANCFIFPDLNAGNIGYKLAQRLGGFEAYGPILQGLRLPMNDLSRGATVDDMLNSAYIALSRSKRTAP